MKNLAKSESKRGVFLRKKRTNQESSSDSNSPESHNSSDHDNFEPEAPEEDFVYKIKNVEKRAFFLLDFISTLLLFIMKKRMAFAFPNVPDISLPQKSEESDRLFAIPFLAHSGEQTVVVAIKDFGTNKRIRTGSKCGQPVPRTYAGEEGSDNRAQKLAPPHHRWSQTEGGMSSKSNLKNLEWRSELLFTDERQPEKRYPECNIPPTESFGGEFVIYGILPSLQLVPASHSTRISATSSLAVDSSSDEVTSRLAVAILSRARTRPGEDAFPVAAEAEQQEQYMLAVGAQFHHSSSQNRFSKLILYASGFSVKVPTKRVETVVKVLASAISGGSVRRVGNLCNSGLTIFTVLSRPSLKARS
ncbi:hypothetical protein ILUMI_27143 [Ignelater luminosus]|uniref:Uncharacterized protein n=1 Tax=Ignelater luminosus TaxID=2038154 RepID=A0A8K0C4X1_IGNLU|nr:hypothetical protein ILUMI_27143 [Ignelater luminosus]